MTQRPSRLTWSLIIVGAIIGGLLAPRGLGILIGGGMGFVIGTALTRRNRPINTDATVVRYVEYVSPTPEDAPGPDVADGARERERLLQQLHGDILLLAHRDLLDSLGAAVRRLRMRGGWSQEEVAALSGFDAAYLDDVEGGRRNLSVVDVARIAEALGVSFGDLVALSEPLPGEGDAGIRPT